MTFNPDNNHRRSIRLKGYDYSQEGAYFITICTHDRQCLFGKIADGEMALNDAGIIAYDTWMETPRLRINVELHPFVIMPNHVHGIIVILDNIPHEIPEHTGVLQTPTDVPLRSPSQTIGAIVRGYKASVTRQINASAKYNVSLRQQSVWQRNYHEHIIRNERSYYAICDYIINNPSRWDTDKFYMAEPSS